MLGVLAGGPWRLVTCIWGLAVRLPGYKGFRLGVGSPEMKLFGFPGRED